MAKNNKTIVISLGGSLICPKEIDVNFLKAFISLIKKQQRANNKAKIIIVTGGGSVCRQYNAGFDAVTKGKKEPTFAKDYVGSAVTRVNATFVQQLLRTLKLKVQPKLIVNPATRVFWGKNTIAIGAAYLPGHSTDYDAALAAIANKADRIINLTNIDYVYTKDPRKFKSAKPLKDLSWDDYKRVLNVKKWEAGLHTPFDPLASQLASKKKLTVAIVNGQKVKSLQSIFSDKPLGTLIHPSK